MDEKAMNCLTYGLFVLTARRGEKDNGCIVNTVQQVTAQPNRIGVAVNKLNFTHDMIMDTGVFNVSIISESAEFALFQRFGFQSGRDVDKFDGFSAWKEAKNGVRYITAGVNAYLGAKVVQTLDLGTHTLFVADVTEMEVIGREPSATYGYYHAHIKPQPGQSTAGQKTKGGEDEFGEDAKSAGKKTVWRCKICGYEYVGEELPEDYICPICKHPASDFEKVVE